MAKINKKPKKGAPAWMVSFADLQQLLLVFFILLFSMSSVDAKKYDQLTESLSIAFNGGTGLLENKGVGMNPGVTTGEKDNEKIGKENSEKESDKNKTDKNTKENEKIAEEIKKHLNKNGVNNKIISKYIETKYSEDGLILRLKDGLLFDSGKAEIRADYAYVLTSIGDILLKLNRDIRIEGHTDNVPISNSEFKTNWELSSTRAINVLKYFVEKDKLNPKKASVVGYGEYRPIVSNNTNKNKALNRRVDIVILNSENN